MKLYIKSKKITTNKEYNVEYINGVVHIQDITTNLYLNFIDNKLVWTKI